MGRSAEMARVFAYHGAEHKAVNAYEHDAPLEPGAVQTFSRFHLRCGTSFVLMVMLVAVIVFSFLGRPPLLWRIAFRVAAIPPVAGIRYQALPAGGRHRSLGPVVLLGLGVLPVTPAVPTR